MKICFLCFSSSEGSGSGMDVYAWNIISRPTNETYFVTVQHNRTSLLDWVLKEFIIPRDQLNLLPVEADIYHAVSPVATKIALLARKRPIITTVHDLIPNSLRETSDYFKLHPRRRRWLNPWHWWFLKKSDYFIATSESTKSDLIRVLNVSPEKISVVHYGTDQRKFGISARTGYHKPKNLLYIGALDQGKGIYDVVKAFALVSRRLIDTNLLIGGRGKALPILMKMVDELGVKNKVRFLGFIPQDDLAHYYSISDVFVFPSYLGFHLMLLDAMASGLPVIAGNLLDAPEYVGDGGWLINPGDINQLGEAMVTALSDPELYANMSKKAVERARLFSWDRTANETIDVYKTFLTRQSVPLPNKDNMVSQSN